MAIPIINDWARYFNDPHEGLGSSYERIVLNDLLEQILIRHQVRMALESPSFGFTGISGINLLALADAGVKVTLEDSDEDRLKLVSELWRRLGRDAECVCNPEFDCLSYPDAAFDLSFSFSALWFVPDLQSFLEEQARVTAKAILISVPNRDGLGYKLQFKDYSPEKYPGLKPENIDPTGIEAILGKLGWRTERAGYFDCPPWPDIGMTKEDLLCRWMRRPVAPRAKSSPEKERKRPLTILDYYSGENPGFCARMRRLQRFEKSVPQRFRRIWAHHYYMLFTRSSA